MFDPILLLNGESGLKKDLFVFPNPVTQNQIVIYLSKAVHDQIKFNLFSISGEIVFSGSVPNFNGEYCVVQLPVGLMAGTYFIQIGDLVERVIVL